MKLTRLYQRILRVLWTFAIALRKTCTLKTLDGWLNLGVLFGFPIGLYSGAFFANWFMGIVLALYVYQIVKETPKFFSLWEAETHKRQWKVVQARIGQGFFHSTSLYFPPGTPISAARSALRGQCGFVTHTAGF